jgi:hypothetical protein
MGVSSVKAIGQNPYTCAITSSAAAGSNVTFNTTQDLTAQGYKVNDRITIRGLNASTAEYIETTTISAITSSSVTLATTTATYGAGTDTVKGYVGADPYPLAVAFYSSGFACRFHNASGIANATGKDWNATNYGSDSQLTPAVPSIADLQPSSRTGNVGLSGINARIDSNFEFRGRWRYLFSAGCQQLPVARKVRDVFTGNIYVVVGPANTFTGTGVSADYGPCVGPIPPVQAGVYS